MGGKVGIPVPGDTGPVAASAYVILMYFIPLPGESGSHTFGYGGIRVRVRGQIDKIQRRHLVVGTRCTDQFPMPDHGFRR